MLHYTLTDEWSYAEKSRHYAKLKAEEMLLKEKRPFWLEEKLNPLDKFVYNYIFRLGFLDGEEGYTLCKLNADGVKYRYQYYKQLRSASPEK